jgi:hypothetical protein
MFTPLTFGIALLAAVIIPRIIGGTPVRVLAFVSLGAAVVYTGFAPLWAGVLIALAPVFGVLLGVLYFYWLGRRALAGKMGEEQQWMAEFINENDEEFIHAMAQINRMEAKELFVLAEDKEELRELALERASEQSD